MSNKLILSIKNYISDYKKNNSLPGQWKLFEYYTEPGNELIHITESLVDSENHRWQITFEDQGSYIHETNLSISLLEQIEPAGTWSRSRNFLTLLHSADFRKNVEFQFAFEKGNLKLLKKDQFGKVIVFAFFKRLI